jgi:hypothetical protein
MSVFIDDPKLLDKLEELEGPRWRSLQSLGFQEALDDHSIPETMQVATLRDVASTWKTLLREEDEMPPEMEHEVVAVLYGAGGYHRYQLRLNGEVVFLRSFAANVEKHAKAQELGFSLG